MYLYMYIYICILVDVYIRNISITIDPYKETLL